MNLQITPSWKTTLEAEFGKKYFLELMRLVSAAYDTQDVFPQYSEICKALNLCSLPDTKVVILGQDPYHDHGQAHGLAFSVPDGVFIPPSLRNIFTEIKNDLGIHAPTSGNLERWAKQGVLLLNTTLTVEVHKPGSHQSFGWEQFTDSVIEKISTEKVNVVFLLWGAQAIKKRDLIDETNHLVLTSPHPSPLSAYRGFFGCKHFSSTNHYLRQHKLTEIIW
jgi:uracil-DNA glycosylase